MKKILMACLGACCFWFSLGATFGSYDFMFGDNDQGFVVEWGFDTGLGTNEVAAEVNSAKTKLVVVITNEVVDPNTVVVTVYNQDGTRDKTFNGTGRRVDTFGAVAGDDYEEPGVTFDASGNILVVVEYDPTGVAGKRGRLIRYTPTGALDTTFAGGTGFLTAAEFDIFRDVHVQSNGRILVTGFDDATNEGLVRRYLADGSGLDTTFNGTGELRIADRHFIALATQSDGSIILAGRVNSTGAGVVARVTTSGALDGTFGTAGEVQYAPESWREVFIQSDDKIITYDDDVLVRYTAGGVADATFGTAGAFEPPTGVSSMGTPVLLSDGKILISGSLVNSSSNFTLWGQIIFRINSDASFDVAFGAFDKTPFISSATGPIAFNYLSLFPTSYFFLPIFSLQMADGAVLVVNAYQDDVGLGTAAYALNRVLLTENKGGGAGGGPVSTTTEGALYDHTKSDLVRFLCQKAAV